MRLQLKLGGGARKSKDGTHLLRVDVCRAATSGPARSQWGQRGFSGTHCALPRGGGARLEGWHLSNPPGDTEEAGRDGLEDAALQGSGAQRGRQPPAHPRRGTHSSGEPRDHRSRARLRDALLRASNITPRRRLAAHQWLKNRYRRGKAKV